MRADPPGQRQSHRAAQPDAQPRQPHQRASAPHAGPQTGAVQAHADQHEWQRFGKSRSGGLNRQPQRCGQPQADGGEKRRDQDLPVGGQRLGDARHHRGFVRAIDREATACQHRVFGHNALDRADPIQPVADQKQGQPHRDQQAGRHPAQQQRCQSAHGVGKQDVAPPQQRIMGIAKQQQPAQPPRLHPGAPHPPAVGGIDKQQHAGAKQQREQRAHLALEQHERNQEPHVAARRGARQMRAETGQRRPPEPGHIDRQNAEQRDPADKVDCGNSWGFSIRTGPAIND